jgi:hypothetical protein
MFSAKPAESAMASTDCTVNPEVSWLLELSRTGVVVEKPVVECLQIVEKGLVGKQEKRTQNPPTFDLSG